MDPRRPPLSVKEVLAHLAELAGDDGCGYWVARVGNRYFVVDPAFPDEPLVLRGRALVPLDRATFDVLGRARWYVADGDFVLDLG